MSLTLIKLFVFFFLFARQVTYQADHFLDKNKDYVVAEHQALLNDSKCSFVANLIPPQPEETSKQSKFSSIGTRFKVISYSDKPFVHFLFHSAYSKEEIFCYWILIFLTATTTISNGNIKYNWTTLHSMC